MKKSLNKICISLTFFLESPYKKTVPLFCVTSHHKTHHITKFHQILSNLTFYTLFQDEAIQKMETRFTGKHVNQTKNQNLLPLSILTLPSRTVPQKSVIDANLKSIPRATSKPRRPVTFGPRRRVLNLSHSRDSWKIQDFFFCLAALRSGLNQFL